MRIGILTYHFVPNFGAQLQTLSTIGYLRKNGHEPVVLHWHPEDLDKIYKTYRIPKEQYEEQENFAENYFPLSRFCREEEDLIKEIERLKIEAIIVGSDALFKYVPVKMRNILQMGRRRPHLYHVDVPSVERLHGNPFFGGFAAKLPFIIPMSAYAISSQNCAFNQMTFIERNLMRRYMENFRKISVRDEWTRNMVETITDRKDVKIYPDPVFAFNQNVDIQVPCYEEIIDKFDLHEKYVLISVWRLNNKEYIDQITEELKRSNLQPVILAMPEGVVVDSSEKVISTPLSPIDWYALIKYSSGYIGERMHPIVVALHNAIPCFSFDEYGVKTNKKIIFPKQKECGIESSKIYHIMHAAGLDTNMYSMQYSQDSYPTAHEVVAKIINFDKKKCKKFAERQLDQYNAGMQTIMKSLSEK